MTVYEFSQLDHDEKVSITTNAVCLSGRKRQGHLVLLYQHGAFYIEVYYHREHRAISNITAFDDMALLDPYLNDTAISVVS